MGMKEAPKDCFECHNLRIQSNSLHVAIVGCRMKQLPQKTYALEKSDSGEIYYTKIFQKLACGLHKVII